MAAPSVSGITVITPTTPTTPLRTSFDGQTVRAAGVLTTVAGYSRISDTTNDDPKLFGGGTTLTSQDHSIRGRLLFVEWTNVNTGGINFVDTPSKGWIAFFSDLTGDNYRVFQIANAVADFALLTSNTLVISPSNNTPNAQSFGTFVQSDVVRVEFYFPRRNNAFAGDQRYKFVLFDPLIIVEGEIANPAIISSAITYAQSQVNQPANIVQSLDRGGLITSLCFAISIGDGSSTLYFSDTSTGTYLFRRASANSTQVNDWPDAQFPSNWIGLRINAAAANTVILSNKILTSNTPYYFEVAGTGTVNINNLTLDNAGLVSIDNPNASIQGTFSSCAVIDMDRGVLNATLINPKANGLEPTANTDFEGLIQGSGAAAVSIVSAGNYSSVRGILRNSTTYDVLVDFPTPGTGQTYVIDISGLINGSDSTTPTGIYVNDADATNTYNITTGSSYSDSDADSAGATVNVIVPQPTLTLTNLVAGSRVYVQNTTNEIELFNEIEATTTWAETVPSGKALLIRARNASGTPKYKPFQTTTGALTSDTSIVINQELDE